MFKHSTGARWRQICSARYCVAAAAASHIIEIAGQSEIEFSDGENERTNERTKN